MPQKNTIHLWLKIIFITAIAAVLIYPRVFPNTKYLSMKIPFYNPDSCYHARRIVYIAEHHMQLPFYDPLIAHPYGAIPMLSPLYDWISALPSFVISLGHPGKALAVQSAMWLTFLFGMLTLLVLGLLIKKSTGSFYAAMLTVLFVGIAAPQIEATNIEIIDHNSLLYLLFSIILLRAYILFTSKNSSSGIKNIFIDAFLLASLFWVWSGAYLYAGFFVLLHLLLSLAGKKKQLLRTLSMRYAVAGFLVAPLAFIHYHLGKKLFAFEYVSLFTIFFLWITAAAMYIILIILTWNADRKNVSMIKLSIACLLLIAGISIIFTPFIEGVKFALAQNIWLSTVQESKPLFSLARGPLKLFTLEKVIADFGYLIFVFPAALFLIIIRRIPLSKELYSILISMTVYFGFLALAQQKYAIEFSIPYGIILALFTSWLYQKVSAEISFPLLAVFSAIIIVSFLPLKRHFSEAFSPLNAFHNGFEWLKQDAGFQHTEINTGHIQKTGIMAPWDLGHHLHFYSEAPTVTDNFGINVEPLSGFYDTARFFLAEDEDSAIRILKQYQCSYVVVTNPIAFDQYPQYVGLNPSAFFTYAASTSEQGISIVLAPKAKFMNTVGFRLAYAYGSANHSNNLQRPDLKALKHFRLVYDSPAATVAGQLVPSGSFKIYRYVEGTTLHVNVPGNPRYELEELIITNNDEAFFYRQKGYLQEGIIAPYPTYRSNLSPYAESCKVSINETTFTFNEVE